MQPRSLHNIIHPARVNPDGRTYVKSGTRAHIIIYVLRQGIVMAALWTLTACVREPELHLPWRDESLDFLLPVIDLDLNVYWDYDIAYGINYDWKGEWYYGWDEADRNMFGELGYIEPTVFNLRRYFTADVPAAPHTSVIENMVEGTHFQGRYNWGYWDILVWNQVQSIDGVQSLHFDETTSLDSVTAYTNPSMRAARYNAPRFTQAYYEPEPLFAAYEEDIDINRNLDGFVYDAERNVYVRTLNMVLMPVTYIYLTQVIIHHNRGRVSGIDGSADLSGMARSTTLNTRRAGDDAITATYGVRFKKDVPLLPYGHEWSDAQKQAAEHVDIIGGRVMTFGIPTVEANTISRADEVKDIHRHYLGVGMLFNNATDSTLVFDVTDQVRQRYKGGVITVELDMDTVPLPTRRGGSGFNAVVQDFEEVTMPEFEM